MQEEKVHASQMLFGSPEDFDAVSRQYREMLAAESLDFLGPITPQELKAARKKLGISQCQVAAITGYLVTRETITRIENGKKIPSIKNSAVIRMAFAYRLQDYSWAPIQGRGPRAKELVYKGGNHEQDKN